MDELIIQYLRGAATPEQLRELRRWRLASPEHARRFQEIETVWRAMEAHDEIDLQTPIPRVPDVFLRRARSNRRPLRWVLTAAAAALVLGIGLGWGGTERASRVGVTQADFRTGTDEMASVALDDGTVVRLGANSRLLVSLGRTERAIRLQGRAFFAVAHDPQRPFRVTTDVGEAVVLGTRFEVDASDDALRLLVVDGRVAVSSGANRFELLEGQQGHTRPDAPLEVTQVPAPEQALDWMGAFVAFQATPLPQVAKELEAHFGLRLELLSAELAERTVTGWFGEDDRDQIPQIICRVAGVICETEGDVIRMSS